MKKIFVSAVLGMVLLTPSNAQAKSYKKAGSWNISLGAGGIYAPEYLGSDEYKFSAIPNIMVKYEDVFEISQRGLKIAALKSNNFNLGIKSSYDRGRDEDDSSILKGLGDVDGSAEVGLYANYKIGSIKIGIDAKKSIGDGHDGLLASLYLSKGYKISNKVFANTKLSSTWADNKYMDSYFGINNKQSQNSAYQIKEYNPNSSIRDVSLDLSLNQKIGTSYSARYFVKYMYLTQDASDSPLVDKYGNENQFIAGISFGYDF